MALRTQIPVRFPDVFPRGAFLVGTVEPINDFDKVKAGTIDPQERDKETGERMWALQVIDADPDARAGQVEMKVKIPAPVQPVPPTEALPGTPFRPIELEGVTITPWLDSNRMTPRIAYSVRCTGMKAPASAPVNSTASNGSAAPGKPERSAA